MAINVLSPRIYNRISAGEVVEKPASVVKEMVENSLDAGATKIKVEIVEGGIKKISVSDNGCGIEKEDLPLAFLPHATSKISDLEDLDSIGTLGFRGEALASISSVSMVSLSTKTKGQATGFKIDSNGGEISKVSEVARLEGTTIVMQNLFFNTPARAKFLRKPKSEEAEITHLIEKLMMGRPDVDFEYVVDGKEVYNHNSGTLEEVMYLIYGRDVHDNLLKLDYCEDAIHVGGFVVSPKISRPNRTYQSLFVNGRYVENYMVSACVQGAYEPLLMKGRFPVYVIKVTMPYESVDVNVHPNKREVKFQNSQKVFGIIRRAVERALVSTNLIAEFEFTNKDEKEWSKFHISNENNLGMTGFEAQPKTDIDKLTIGEGKSYNVSVDDGADEKIVSPKEYQKRGIEIINMPQFSTIKSDSQDKNKNRPGGRIFFDQTGDSFLREVELSVKRDEEKKKQEEKPVTQFVEEKFLKNRAEEIKIVGVVFKTYIITEFEDSVYVVDQHAMHERQLYDKLKAEVDGHNVAKQPLLIPYEFKMLAKDRDFFEDKLADLRKIGFEIIESGDNFSVSCVPFVLSGIKLDKFIEEVLSDESLRERKASELINEKLCQTACKHAIRAGDSVSNDEILYLIDKMKEGVALCPHGRPIIVKITRKELEKMFKRTL